MGLLNKIKGILFEEVEEDDRENHGVVGEVA